MREDWFNGTVIFLFVVLAGAYARLDPHGVFVRKGPSPGNACINNLRQLDGAAEQWRLENNRTTNEFPTPAQAAIYIKGGIPVCPASGVYRFNTTNGLPTCSIAGHVLP